MTKTFTDILGKPLAEGDEICVAFPDDNSAELRIGTIIGITEKETQRWNHNLKAYFPGPPQYTLEIKWDKDKSPSYVPEKPTKLNKTKGRIIKL